MGDVAVLDWILAAVLLLSFLLGAWRGLVYEVLSVISWIAAFVLAQLFAPQVAQMFTLGGSGEAVRYAVAFMGVFIVVVFAGGLLAWITKKMIDAVGLRPIDRALGAMFGLLRGALLVLAVGIVINMTPLKRVEWWTESQGAALATAALKAMKPVLPDQFGKYLP
jgi:membrane protein required for colicin V production